MLDAPKPDKKVFDQWRAQPEIALLMEHANAGPVVESLLLAAWNRGFTQGTAAVAMELLKEMFKHDKEAKASFADGVLASETNKV